MSPTATRAMILLGALLSLGSVNYSIYEKERVIRSGEMVYLELVSIDPRSLMQGDYQALRFQLADAIAASRSTLPDGGRGGTAPIAIDERHVGRLGSAADILRIRYRLRNGRVWLGTNAYFFAEGSAQRYFNARYGQFRIDPASGEAVLVSLYDAQLHAL
jgi:uncharacterized membrane-anchored protein